MKISVITPTCFRPLMFVEMCESLLETTKGYDVEHITVIDEDRQTYKLADFYSGVVDYSKVKRGALAAWNRGLEICTGDIIVPGGDDHLYHAGWLEYALESHKMRLGGYGVVGMNDGAYNENQVATMWLFDRQYCKDVMGGIFAPPVYTYLCVDLEWNEKAKMTGHYYRDMRAIVEHRHSAHGKRPFDKHDESKTQDMVDRDTATFERRKAENFPITWESLI